MLTIAAFYQFKSKSNFKDLHQPFIEFCEARDIKGTILLAEEGINGTVAGPDKGIQELKEFFEKNDFTDLEYKESYTKDEPFFRLKVRLKKEIVTLGQEGISPTCMVGQYVDPEDWNALISRDDVINIDTRNDYEYIIGTFKGAINPSTDSFREFPAFVEKYMGGDKEKSVAMFCTGGIRCEKSTALLLSMGFKKVYHLKGGILKYLENIPESESLWQGECFVFDHRTAVVHGMKVGTYIKCHGCRMPLSPDNVRSSHYVEGIKCHYCFDSHDEVHFQRVAERQKQMKLARSRGISHIGSKRVVRKYKKESDASHAA